MRARESQIGKIYNSLTVVEEHSKTRNGHYRYICKCFCGNKTTVLLTHLKQGNTKSCSECSLKTGSNHTQWLGIGEMSGDFWHNHVVASARGSKGSRKELELTVTKEQVWDLFLFQERKCALSGLELRFPRINKDRDYTASLDRIDSSLGYIEGNIQWVHKDINFMKNKFNNEYFIQMCKHVNNNFV